MFHPINQYHCYGMRWHPHQLNAFPNQIDNPLEYTHMHKTIYLIALKFPTKPIILPNINMTLTPMLQNTNKAQRLQR